MSSVRERLRWHIANLLNRLPGQCWTELVCWSLDGMRVSRRNDRNPLPWRPITEACRSGIERNGCCYCNKLKAGGPRG